jgi:hypothetical protein
MSLKKTKFIWISVVVLFVSFVLYICFNLFGSPWGRNYYEKKMISYLNEKYHSTFVVHNMWFNALGIGYQGTAYPKNEPSLTFTVEQSSNEKSGFTDMYPSVFWKSEKAKSMKDFIQNLFPNLDQNSFTVEPQFEEIMGPHIPTYRSIGLDVGANCLMKIKLEQNWFDLSAAEQKIEIEKIKQIITYLQNHHFSVYIVFFSIRKQ